MEYQPFCDTEIKYLSKQKMEEQLLSISGQNIALILSVSSVDRWDLTQLLQTMGQENQIIWINEINANPTQEDVLSSIKKLDNIAIDLIIAIGGGSAIDLAKAISAFYEAGNSLPTLDTLTIAIRQKLYGTKHSFIDIIAVPTTAGTGSELTQWATIWDKDGQEKYSIDCLQLKPKIALIIPELTLTLTKEMTLITGLDALSHAIEAYWSKHTNPLVQDLAFRSILLILWNLPPVLKMPDNLSLRESMCRASVLAGLAFSMTRTTACHSISYPMTLLYGIPHGLAVAMTLGEVGDKNRGSFPNDQELYDLFKPFGGIQPWLDEVSKDIIKLRLSTFHLMNQDIELLVREAFTGGRMDNNPINLSKEDVREILTNIF